MTAIAITAFSVSVGGYDEPSFEGKGGSHEEAVADCLAKIRQSLADPRSSSIQLSGGTWVPYAEYPSVPKEVPDGMTLVVAVRSSHSDGSAYDYRYLAMAPGAHSLRLLDGWEPLQLLVAEAPVHICTMDSNSEASYELPVGTLQWRGGQWMPCPYLEYSY